MNHDFILKSDFFGETKCSVKLCSSVIIHKAEKDKDGFR